MLQCAYYYGCQSQRRLCQIKHPFSCKIYEDDMHHVRCSRRGMARYGYVSITFVNIRIFSALFLFCFSFLMRCPCQVACRLVSLLGSFFPRGRGGGMEKRLTIDSYTAVRLQRLKHATHEACFVSVPHICSEVMFCPASFLSFIEL